METPSPSSAVGSVTPALARPLTDGEAAHLDRLREWLRRDGTDARDAAALDDRWERLLATHPPHVTAPAGVAAALGIAVGDLLVAAVPDAVWVMCPGPEGATPGVVLPAHPHLPVLPVLDAHARWRVRSPRWAAEYVGRAAAHLERTRPRVPSPRAATPTGPRAATPTGPGAAAPAAPRVPQPAASTEVWTPTFAAGVAPVPDPAPAPAPGTTSAATPGTEDPAPGTAPAAPEEVVAPAPDATTGPAAALTPEDLPHRPSDRVQDLALRALEVALDRAVQDPAGCAPFVLVREEHDVEVLDFDHSDAGVAQARAAAREGRYTAAAVAWTSPAGATHPHPRVVVDASAAGLPGIRVAHAFTHDPDGGREIGGPQVVGQSAPVL